MALDCLHLQDGPNTGTGRNKIRYQYGKPHLDETGGRDFSLENVIHMIDEDQDDPDKKKRTCLAYRLPLPHKHIVTKPSCRRPFTE